MCTQCNTVQPQKEGTLPSATHVVNSGDILLCDQPDTEGQMLLELTYGWSLKAQCIEPRSDHWGRGERGQGLRVGTWRRAGQKVPTSGYEMSERWA